MLSVLLANALFLSIWTTIASAQKDICVNTMTKFDTIGKGGFKPGQDVLKEIKVCIMTISLSLSLSLSLPLFREDKLSNHSRALENKECIIDHTTVFISIMIQFLCTSGEQEKVHVH